MDPSELINKKGSCSLNEYNSPPKTAFCFFFHITNLSDSEEDEKADSINYSEFKKRHPKECHAIWKNERGGMEYIYVNGEETTNRINGKMDENPLEAEIKSVLQFLNSNNKTEIQIKEGYDYVLIKKVIADNLFNGCSRLSFKSMPDFRKFILRLGFNNICDSKTLNKYYKSIQGQYPHYNYSDNKGHTSNEKDRRNRIIVEFVNKMREIRGYS